VRADAYPTAAAVRPTRLGLWSRTCLAVGISTLS
jgi:hypothetical protein